MSRFSQYARKLDEIVRAALNEYEKAVSRRNEADERRKQYPERNLLVSPDYAVTSARAKADYMAADQAVRAARNKMGGEYMQQIKAVRRELEDAVNKAYQVDPEQIDNATLELLKSGICTPDEYMELLDKAAASGNATMARLVGKYAGDAAAAALEAAGGHYSDQTAAALRAVTIKAKGYNGNEYLEAFDNLVSVFERACRDPSLSTTARWDTLTPEIISAF